jgi:hypothetical protein
MKTIPDMPNDEINLVAVIGIHRLEPCGVKVAWRARIYGSDPIVRILRVRNGAKSGTGSFWNMKKNQLFSWHLQSGAS